MSAKREAIMHLDGCHFFVWVGRDADGQVVLTYYERQGTDLRLHGRFGYDEDGECDRCKALRAGASPASVSRHIDRWPDDAKESMFRVFEVIAEIENGAGEDSRSSLPVVPDGPDASSEGDANREHLSSAEAARVPDPEFGAGRGSDTEGAAARNSLPTTSALDQLIATFNTQEIGAAGRELFPGRSLKSLTDDEVERLADHLKASTPV